MFQSLERFSKLVDSLQERSREDLRLMACAQRKANYLNIYESYYYFYEQKPNLQETLQRVRDTLAVVFPDAQEDCVHHFYKNIEAVAKKQTGGHEPRFWPNWVLAFEETNE